jgi:hypothetical protein
VDKSGAVTINKGPINISIGTPDHALYYLALKSYYDIVEFDIDDAFHGQLVAALKSQKDKPLPPGTPTYNDPTKPGYKIEIPEGDWLEGLKGKVSNGRVTRGTEFLEQASKTAYSPKEVAAFYKQVLAHNDKVATQQAKKLLKNYPVEWDGNKETFTVEEGDEVDWKDLKEHLWVINNAYFDKKLRGV